MIKTLGKKNGLAGKVSCFMLKQQQPVSFHMLMLLSASFSFIHLGQGLARHIFVGVGIGIVFGIDLVSFCLLRTHHM